MIAKQYVKLLLSNIFLEFDGVNFGKTKNRNAMKNFKLLLLAATVCGITAACSDDDNNSTSNQNADLVGTYKLSSWNAPMAVDFDGDGTANTNMMNESDCYTDSMLRVNRDGTYTLTTNYVDITSTGTVSCKTELSSGSWVRSGNTFTTTNTVNGIGNNTEYTFASGSGPAGTTLTRYMALANYPSVDTEGNQVYATGNVNTVMTRQ